MKVLLNYFPFPVLLLFLLAVSLPVVGSLYLNQQLQIMWLQQVEEKLALTASQAKAKINSWIEVNRRALAMASQLEAVVSMDEARQTPVLEAFAANYDWNYLVFTVDMNGNNIARSDGNALRYYGDRSYFQQVAQGGELGLQLVIGKTSQKPAYILSHPIRDGRGELVGVLAIAATLEAISAAVLDQRLGTTGFTFLINAQRELVADGRPDRVGMALLDMGDHPALAAGGNAVDTLISYRDTTGIRYLGYKASLDLGWQLVVQQQYDEAMDSVKNSSQQTLLLLLVSVMATLISVPLIVVHFRRPLVNLVSAVKRLDTSTTMLPRQLTERRDDWGFLAQWVQAIDRRHREATRELRILQNRL